jgi:hypothetical protein
LKCRLLCLSNAGDSGGIHALIHRAFSVWCWSRNRRAAFAVHRARRRRTRRVARGDHDAGHTLRTAAGPRRGRAPTPSSNRPSPNSVSVEVLGAGIDYSVNYERVLLDQLALRAGLSYLSFQPVSAPGTSSATVTYVTVPVTASYIGLRKGPSSLELGGGGVFIYTSAAASALGVSASASGVLPEGVAMVGYRLHPVDHAGFQFRIGAIAIFGPDLGLQAANPGAFGVIPSGYISFGASF